MITITRHMDGYDIAQEIRMERQVLKKFSFLILEGVTDIKRFERYIDSTICSIVNCFGRKKHAVDAIELLYDEGFMGALAIVDADFDRITSSIKTHEGVIYSENHDLDLDWTTPAVIERYLSEVADRKKYTAYGPPSDIIDKILSGLKPISIAKLLNEEKVINYKLSGIDAGKCFSNFTVDIEVYLDLIFDGRPPNPSARYILKQKVMARIERAYDLRQLTNGHDFYCALGASLRNVLGDRLESQTWGREVESHLRLTHDENDFKKTAVCSAILAWTLNNAPFRILSS